MVQVFTQTTNLNKVRCATRKSQRTIARAEDEFAFYPVKPQPKDRSNDFAVKITGANKNVQKYLDGSLPGDYGFDPLYLYGPSSLNGVPQQIFLAPAWLRHSEVFHCRWAMLGVVGIIGPEILNAAGLIPKETAIKWWTTGVYPPAGTDYDYWIDPWGLFWVEVVAMQFAELKRWQDYRYPGSQAKQWFLGIEGGLHGAGNQYESAYPGGLFNPLGWATKDDTSTKDLRTKEINNGRLAMVSCLGFAAQAALTRKGPLECLTDHLSNPAANNLLTNLNQVNV